MSNEILILYKRFTQTICLNFAVVMSYIVIVASVPYVMYGTEEQVITHAGSSRVSIAIIHCCDSVCLSVCPHDKTKWLCRCDVTPLNETAPHSRRELCTLSSALQPL